MIDKSHHQSIENSTISGSNVNYDDNSTLTNSIQQLPENQSELKELLKTLGELIEKSQLSQDDKQDAFQQAQTIVEASKKPVKENRSIVRKALKYFKGLASDLKGIPSAVELRIPLLSCSDIETLLAHFLPRRDVGVDEVVRQMEVRHHKRQASIDSAFNKQQLE